MDKFLVEGRVLQSPIPPVIDRHGRSHVGVYVETASGAIVRDIPESCRVTSETDMLPQIFQLVRDVAAVDDTHSPADARLTGLVSRAAALVPHLPPAPVSDVVLRAREICAGVSTRGSTARAYRDGAHDESHSMSCVIAALGSVS